MEKLEEKQELTYYQKNREKISEKAKKKYAEDAEFRKKKIESAKKNYHARQLKKKQKQIESLGKTK